MANPSQLWRWLRLKLHGTVAEKIIAEAITENAIRDNDKAFEEITQMYKEIPEKSAGLREKLEKVGTPFADLENLMRDELRQRRRRETVSRREAIRSRRYE